MNELVKPLQRTKSNRISWSSVHPSVLLALSTVSRAINGLLIFKLIAVYCTVEAFGLLSQLMGVIAMVGMVTGGGIGHGLTRQLAANMGEAEALRSLHSAWKILVWTSVLLAICLALSSQHLAKYLLGNNEFVFIFLALAITQPLTGVASLAHATATAFAQYRWILRTSATSACLGVICVYIGLTLGGTLGGALALVINASMPGLISILISSNVIHAWRRSILQAEFSRRDVKQLLKYACVSLLGAVSLSISQIATRDLLGSNLGWSSVALWQAVTKLSDLFMQFISIYLVGYVLPKLAAIGSYQMMKEPLLRITFSLVIAIVGTSTIVWSQSQILLSLLFSESFTSADMLLPWQLAGDLFRTIAVCMSTAMLARGDTKASILYEVTQGGLLFLLTALLIHQSAILAPVHSYLLTYILLATAMTFVWFNKTRRESDYRD